MVKRTKITRARLDAAAADITSSLIAGIDRTWQVIGHDVLSCCAEMQETCTNEAAIESCIDADRMKDYAPEAWAEVKALFEKHDYDVVLRALTRRINLA